MAAMEKVSFPPLIAELSEKSSLYNQWYKESEMKYGNLPAHAIAGWMAEVAEPVIKATFALNSAPEKVHEVVKALYQETLKLIGSGLAIRYKEEYKEAWLLMGEMPNLTIKFPIKTILLLNDVLANLHLYAPEKITDWCRLMRSSSPEIKTIEDFKILGRMYAWKCGLAHLRIRLKTDFEELPQNLQESLGSTLGLEEKTMQLFENPWTNNCTKFEGVHGGFKGTAGFFEKPPKLAQIDGTIFVTDSKNSYALFADQFGKVLIAANTMEASAILSNVKRVETLEKWLGKDNEKIDGSTISSFAATEDTLIFTLQNSYFLYLFSLGNA
jgi:hypothetical protein